jgi:hypothetical protein
MHHVCFTGLLGCLTSLFQLLRRLYVLPPISGLKNKAKYSTSTAILTAQFNNGDHNTHFHCGEHLKSYKKGSMS